MDKEIMGKVKELEPTREEIKGAFKKTIERWEKIVEDVEYYHKSSCLLCDLFPDFVASCDENTCPVALYAEDSVCDGTPYWEFSSDKTPANALAELNFLRKVYIWWTERDSKGEPLEGYKKEEKKEEWEDYTHHISWETKDYPDAELPYLLYGTNYKGEEIVYVNESGKHICHDHKEKYRLEQQGETFRILKKI